MADRSYESKLKKGEMMIEALKRNWWVLVIRGVCGIIFGIIAFAYPGLALATLVLLFGAWVLIDGVFRIVGATAGRASDPDWGFHLIIGILGVLVGFHFLSQFDCQSNLSRADHQRPGCDVNDQRQ